VTLNLCSTVGIVSKAQTQCTVELPRHSLVRDPAAEQDMLHNPYGATEAKSGWFLTSDLYSKRTSISKTSESW
jgi:hypothetical protein